MRGFSLLSRESWYLKFLAARSALLSIEIAAPFYVLYTKQMLSLEAGTLGLIVIAAGISAALSSPVWGRFADLSSRRVLIIGGLLGAVTGAAALAVGVLPATFQSPYLYGALFVLLGFAESGVLLGRKTFLIDRVDPAERSTYVAFANTAMGVIMVVFGLLGFVAQFYGIRTLITVLILLGLAGAAISYLLPETAFEQQG